MYRTLFFVPGQLIHIASNHISYERRKHIKAASHFFSRRSYNTFRTIYVKEDQLATMSTKCIENLSIFITSWTLMTRASA